MAKNKKTKKEVVIEEQPMETIDEVLLTQKKLEECEWCFQFDNDEPQIFATADENSGDPEVMIKLRNTSESHLTFTDTAKNKKFSIYARPKKS